MKTSLYLATAEGLAVITGSENAWEGRLCLKGTQIQCVVVGPGPNRVIYCGTFGQGILRSSDGGLTWTVSSGLEGARVTALSSRKDGTLYAGTEPSAIYRSDDEGKVWYQSGTLLTLPSASTWSFPPRPDTHHVQAILPDLAQPGRLHVAIEAGALLRTDDEGGSWRDRVPGGPLDTHTLAVHAEEPTRLMSAAGDGCFESVDDGESWKRLDDGLEHHYCWSIAISAADPRTMVLSASQSAFTAHSTQAARPFIYRRSGTGRWHLAMDGLAMLSRARIPVVVASGRQAGCFYLAAEGSVYRSTDDGLSWQTLAIQWSGHALTRHSLNMAIMEDAG